MFEILFKPHILLLLVSSILTVFITLLNRILVNKKLMDEIKAKMVELRENITKAQKEGDLESVNKFFNEMMKANTQFMKQNLKSLIVSVIVVLLVFPLIGSNFSGLTVYMPFELPILGSKLNWVAWYVFVSFAIGWLARKLME